VTRWRRKGDGVSMICVRVGVFGVLEAGFGLVR